VVTMPAAVTVNNCSEQCRQLHNSWGTGHQQPKEIQVAVGFT